MPDTTTDLGFAEVFDLYRWGGLLPLPRNEKFPPPTGYTGAAGKFPDLDDVLEWDDRAPGNYALRLPDGVLAFDVDDYDKHGKPKPGAQSMRELSARAGVELPPTWKSSGRGPGDSGHLFFRYPGGKRATQPGKGVELIQHHHRYSVVWPSRVTDDDADRVYQWYTPTGEVSPRPPCRDELAELPAEWDAILLEGAATDYGTAGEDEARALADELMADAAEPCQHLLDLLDRYTLKVTEDGASHHDVMVRGTIAVAMAWAEGHTGAAAVLGALRETFLDEVGADRAPEYDRAVLGAAGKAAHAYPLDDRRAHAPASCPMAALDLSTFDDFDDAPDAGVVVLPPLDARWDPTSSSEIGLAREALNALAPLDRYDPSQGTWVCYSPADLRWVENRDKNNWERAALNGLAKRMPAGERIKLAKIKDPDTGRFRRETLEDAFENHGTELNRQFARRELLESDGPRGRVARLLLDEAASGATCDVESLDARRDVLWAGGRCWDLRRSLGGLVESDVPLATPHLKTATVLPDASCPTPRWDAALAVMQPDKHRRDYLLHLLGIATTGEAEAVCIVLHGAPGTGKTAVMDLVSRVLGDYAAPIDPDVLDGEKSSESKLFDLKGVRMGTIDEGIRGDRQDRTERLKALTGGSAKIRAARKFKDAVSFTPTHTLVLTENKMPPVRDEAMLRRMRSVPFDADPADLVRVVREAVYHGPGGVEGWLEEEGPGVLAKLIQYAAAAYADDKTYAQPDDIAQDMLDLNHDLDGRLGWFDECVEPVTIPGEEVSSSDLYTSYRDYCKRMGQTSGMDSAGMFYRWLTKKGYPVVRSKGKKCRALQFRPSANMFD